MDHSFTRLPAELLRDFGVSEDAGLTQDQVLRLREKHGSNGKSPVSFIQQWIGFRETLSRKENGPQLTFLFLQLLRKKKLPLSGN